ncbi:glucose 1-dehydrogenase [Neobacillus niacini]|uniref:SDR family NAD(P)-dependent oxidoreductase n=1 Tax=Neobacillus niacini TaxID=86668 RepID=UPI0021CB04AC|nr:glucose 1-dehydrogenase [Neobacillus niacini]MCM3766174.1 glucose 1-dehydrogenase [Neobacillus niacini]
MKIDYTGKVALVTGGASGIGRSICIEFAKAGADVVCVDIDQKMGEETVSLIKKEGREGIFIHADVSNPSDVKNYVNQTIARFNRIDVFSNNAGWEGVIKPTTEYPEEIFNKVMDINVRGVFLGMKYVLPEMIRQRSGAIINTASAAGLVGAPGFVAYTASKHAVIGMTKTVALEVAREGIRVNAICPGAVHTRMMRSIENGVSPSDPEAFLSSREKAIPDGRYAEAIEIAHKVLFLGSEFASHMTGHYLAIDGGALAT